MLQWRKLDKRYKGLFCVLLQLHANIFSKKDVQRSETNGTKETRGEDIEETPSLLNRGSKVGLQRSGKQPDQENLIRMTG